MKFDLTVGVSARHCHLTRETMDVLFGKGSELHKKKPISQPGQFASEEQIKLVTEKGEMVFRILGPLRPYDQIELSMSEARKMGVKPVMRQSGDLDNTPAMHLVGPKGEIDLPKGVIVAGRHIHLCPATATKYGLKNHDIVSLVVKGDRALRFDNVVVRTGETHADEIHIDTDEGNACNVKNGDMMEVVW
ncbi:MAG: phosphate propanoyltransferase [Acidaminococcaceae bacterium]|nr:phosphate propanoyltransferase [Acidaminococcaceae bacterium]MDO4935777.1 phosphate propanoyltransferase [Phascolarctobacterium sp.]